MTVLEAGEKHQELLDELLSDIEAYNPEVDRELLARAFRFAADAHEGQQRRSGEAFIRHPWGAAMILAELRQACKILGVTDRAKAVGRTGLLERAPVGVAEDVGVAQLAVESGLRKALRDKLVEAIQQFQPEILAAHSLGTLITYDLFRNDPRGKRPALEA